MNAKEKKCLAVAAEKAAAAESWAAQVHSHFAFLIKDYGFRVARVMAMSRFSEIVYQSETTEVCIGWDTGEFHLTFERLIRLKLRAFPQPYPVLDTDAESLRFFMDDLVRLRAPHLIKERKDMYGYGWSLELLAQAAQSHAKDLLKGDSSAFESVEVFVKKRREVYEKGRRIIEKETREIPQPLRWAFKQIADDTARFCDDYLDSAHAEICRRVAKELCQIPESPLGSGKFETWASAIVHVVCSDNDLFNPLHSSHVSAETIAKHFRLAVTTIQAKSKKVHHLLKESTTSTWRRRTSSAKS